MGGDFLSKCYDDKAAINILNLPLLCDILFAISVSYALCIFKGILTDSILRALSKI